jgi:hypothetical protein
MKRIIFLLALAIPAGAYSQRPRLSATERATYDSLRARVLAGDTTVDYGELRVLYARIPDDGKPSPGDAFERAKAANDSLVRRAILDTILTAYAGHVRAHRDVGRLFASFGDSTHASEEAAIVRAFVRSIASSDGTSPETAMLVWNIAEEYAVMESLGATKDYSQALVQGKTSKGDEAFDVLTAKTDDGKSVTRYFRLGWWEK